MKGKVKVAHLAFELDQLPDCSEKARVFQEGRADLEAALPQVLMNDINRRNDVPYSGKLRCLLGRNSVKESGEFPSQKEQILHRCIMKVGG
ncbi:hypothetical protein D3C87_1958390 [compost metagenome]